ncbi:MAG: transglutaminase domain-containing protein [Eubacteriales bacterium]|nr:transglutaminase domain-containing protein [Eubacteriales bacterium]
MKKKNGFRRIVPILLTVSMSMGAAAPTLADEQNIAGFEEQAFAASEDFLADEGVLDFESQVPEQPVQTPDLSEEQAPEEVEISQLPQETPTEEAPSEETGENPSQDPGEEEIFLNPDEENTGENQEPQEPPSPDAEAIEEDLFSDAAVSEEPVSEDAEETGAEGQDNRTCEIRIDGDWIYYEWYQKKENKAVCIERFGWNRKRNEWRHFDGSDTPKETPFEKLGLLLLGRENGQDYYYYLEKIADGTLIAARTGFVFNQTTQKYEYFLTSEDGGKPEYNPDSSVPVDFVAGRKADITAYQGIQTIDDKIYYLQADGSLLKGQSIIVDDKTSKTGRKKYIFDANGECKEHYDYYKPCWVKDTNGYRWRRENGEFYATGKAHWKSIAGNRYYILADGYRKTGVVITNGKRYYLNQNGLRKTGWLQLGGKWYYLSKKTGEALTGWQKIGGEKYYMNRNAVRVHGWNRINGKTYYFDPKTGAMKTGLLVLNGKRYYQDPQTGIRVTGWKEISSKWYYFSKSKKSAAALTGWQKISGNRYYFNKYGVRQSGWIKYNGVYNYCMPSTGAVATNAWITYKDKIYYVGSTGVRVTGLVTIGGKKYYFQSNGVLVTNQQHYQINNQYYNIDENGVVSAISIAAYYAEERLNQIGWNLQAAFSWSSSMPYYSLGGVPSGQVHSVYYSVFGFKYGMGDCNVMAATFYQMARALGYEAYLISGYVPLAAGGMGDHGWVEIVINGATYVCDPDFAYETGRNGYMITYGASGTWQYTGGRRVS